ncbi:MAG: hypothetical protein HY268_14755 [Deltaproteobacteria bacterium]|nr:hypothetical protein [Deltaproteobacteria bacterium]
MKFSNDAWALYRQRFGLPDVDRAKLEAQMQQDMTDFRQKARGNEEKALGLMILDTARDMAQTLRLDENFVLKQLIKYAPRRGRSRLKKAVRLARGGH